jgi:hypothetical protein
MAWEEIAGTLGVEAVKKFFEMKRIFSQSAWPLVTSTIFSI